MTPSADPIPFDLRPPSDRDYFDRWGPGLVVVLPPHRPGPAEWGAGGPPHGGAWIHVGEDGRIRAFTGKVEVGQGTRTALVLLVAEELNLPPESVELTMGDTDVSPWDMGTFGSRSMPDAGEHIRLAAATARDVLLDLAATAFGIARSKLECADGYVRTNEEGGSRSIRYADLVNGLRRLETVAPSARPQPAIQWRRAGHAATNLGAREIVTGARQYTSDLRFPGMLHGKLLFAPSYGARLRGVDLSAARAMPGVTAVHEGGLVAVAAPDLLTAQAALKALRAQL